MSGDSYRKPTPTSPLFNQLDGKVDRRSYVGTYEIIDGVPRCVSSTLADATYALELFMDKSYLKGGTIPQTTKKIEHIFELS